MPDATIQDLINLQNQSASIEDLFVSLPLISFGEYINTPVSFPVFVAPFPLAITSVALAQWQGGTVVASTSNYWTVEVRVNSISNVQKVVASKTTKIEPLPLRVAWNLNDVPFTNPNCAANEIINMAFFPSGSVSALSGNLVVTVGYRPL